MLNATPWDLTSTEESIPTDPSSELWIKVNVGKKRDLLIGAYYRPRANDKTSLLQFHDFVQYAIKSRNAAVMLGGGFNFPGWTRF